MHFISILANKIFAYIVQFQDVWFRVLLFLVVAPLILLHSSCWLLILRLYRWKYASPKMTRLKLSFKLWPKSQKQLWVCVTNPIDRAMRVSNNKPTSSTLEPRPSTMYTPGWTSHMRTRMNSLKAKCEDKCVLHRASRLGPAAAHLGDHSATKCLGPDLPSTVWPPILKVGKVKYLNGSCLQRLNVGQLGESQQEKWQSSSELLAEHLLKGIIWWSFIIFLKGLIWWSFIIYLKGIIWWSFIKC